LFSQLRRRHRAKWNPNKDLGYKVSVQNTPDPKADINHHINYIAAQDCPTLNTTMVTHFTSDMYEMDEKLAKMKRFIDKGGVGICFSKGVEDYLGDQGMNRKQLTTVLPAHDGRKRRPRIIMIAFKVYPDGRKREEMFEKLCATIDPNKFIFRIMGPGWKPTLDKLVSKKIQIQWLENYSEEFYNELLSSSDYCLYTGGEDAIAQCIVDAKNAGCRIIAPPQEDVEVEYQWKTQRELNKIFEKLAENPVEKWTWENYSRRHAAIWEDMYKSSLKPTKEVKK
jgi:hypothetical protein